MPTRPRKPAPQEKIGYGRPPKAYQFKKGQSGNPSGRPKGSVSLARLLEAALAQRMTVRVNGRRRKVTKLEALTRQLTDLAVAGDARIMRLLLAQIREAEARAAEEPATREELGAADREVIAALMVRLGRGAGQ